MEPLLEPSHVEVRHHFCRCFPDRRCVRFGGVAAGAAGVAKVLFGLFLVLTVVFLVLAALGVGAVRKAID